MSPRQWLLHRSIDRLAEMKADAALNQERIDEYFVKGSTIANEVTNKEVMRRLAGFVMKRSIGGEFEKRVYNPPNFWDAVHDYYYFHLRPSDLARKRFNSEFESLKIK
jgi:hypothetical protein